MSYRLSNARKSNFATEPVPALPGLDGKPVVSDRDVLQARVEAGDRVVVVDDVHTQQGLSTADCLLEQGRHVE